MFKSSWMRSKGNKYNNTKVVVDGLKFMSKAEANYYQELKIRKRAKDIIDFTCQVPFVIQEGFVDSQGQKQQPIKYIADFVVQHKGYNEIVDVKGQETDVFKMKWKMLKYLMREKNLYKLTIIKK